MAKGFPGMGGGNMNNLLKQAQQMQRKMAEMQEEIEKSEFVASSGGGAITVTVNGKNEILDMKINKEVIDPDDAEMLQDLIITAVNEAMRSAKEASNSEMSKLTGGLNIPGF